MIPLEQKGTTLLDQVKSLQNLIKKESSQKDISKHLKYDSFFYFSYSNP